MLESLVVWSVGLIGHLLKSSVTLVKQLSPSSIYQLLRDPFKMWDMFAKITGYSKKSDKKGGKRTSRNVPDKAQSSEFPTTSKQSGSKKNRANKQLAHGSGQTSQKGNQSNSKESRDELYDATNADFRNKKRANYEENTSDDIESLWKCQSSGPTFSTANTGSKMAGNSNSKKSNKQEGKGTSLNVPDKAQSSEFATKTKQLAHGSGQTSQKGNQSNYNESGDELYDATNADFRNKKRANYEENTSDDIESLRKCQSLGPTFSIENTGMFSENINLMHYEPAPPVKKYHSSGGQKSKVTSFEEDWQKLKALSIEDKRKLYTCNKYNTVEDVESWTTYSQTNSYDLKKMQSIFNEHRLFTDGMGYTVDEDINGKVSIFIGDITSLEIDCIVNAANSSLLGGGGVDGAIHRAAGKSLLKECRTLGGCDVGEAKITRGYNLPSKFIIHTVGPMRTDALLLRACYQNTLELALQNDLRTIAFPCISTGIYGFPNDEAVKVVLPFVRQFLATHADRFDRIIFCLFMKEDVALYTKFMQVCFPLKVLKNKIKDH